MERSSGVIALVCFVFLSAVTPVTAGSGNGKIRECLKSKNCKFVVTGTATEDPRMSFLVHDRVWKTFTDLDKYDLRRMLRARIREANGKPDKYVHVSKRAPSYERIKTNIENMQSYSVFVSHGKDKKGILQLDEEIMVNY
jgi:hypothetical protein